MAEAVQRKATSIFETVDTFLSAIPWTRNRMVLVFLREHGAREYIQVRTFNRHQVKGCWYPAPRFYMVPLECAAQLGQALIAAAKGRPFGAEPEWYRDFEKQYAALRKSKVRVPEDVQPPDEDG